MTRYCTAANIGHSNEGQTIFWPDFNAQRKIVEVLNRHKTLRKCRAIKLYMTASEKAEDQAQCRMRRLGTLCGAGGTAL